MSTEPYHHREAKRKLTPSREEQGYEESSPLVADQRENPLSIPLNPIVQRGRDPELFWMHKYKGDAALGTALAELKRQIKDKAPHVQLKAALEQLEHAISSYGQNPEIEELRIDIRSLYRVEHISPEMLIKKLFTVKRKEVLEAEGALFSVQEIFGNALQLDELEKPTHYYAHDIDWSNRLIQGDSLLVMTSLLEREGMKGQVQCIYLDPPYGIKYGSNWQVKLNERDVKDGQDDSLSPEPEQIKAFRDTWELGIHSYLSYLRDRLLVARELLTESGSCFVQISDENVHLVRNLMDEVFGSENFVSEIQFGKTTGLSSNFLYGICDYIIWYGKNKESTKYNQIYNSKIIGGLGASKYSRIELPTGERRLLTKEEKEGSVELPEGTRFWVDDNLTSQGNPLLKFVFNGVNYSGTYKTNIAGLNRLVEKKRIYAASGTIRFVRYFDDFPVTPINSAWMDIGGIQSRVDSKVYVVQTANEAIKRCILMTTDPGDLVLDPTCGSGTTAYVAEQWGRRWITIDTSRIALNIAKTRLMTARFPWYRLHDEAEQDLRQGFQYKKVPHITLKSLANDEPPEEETLYDQPLVDKSRMRVAGKFTVETLQSFEPLAPKALSQAAHTELDEAQFHERIYEHLRTSGIRNGDRNEQAIFTRIEPLGHPYLHAKGYYPRIVNGQAVEGLAYIHIGPRFGTVSKPAVNEAVKASRQLPEPPDWLVILGFTFESHTEAETQTIRLGGVEVSRVRMHDDLLQEGLLKKDKKAASFVTIGEPDVELKVNPDGMVQVEIRGLDIYDPVRDELKARSVADIAYWMVDDEYDGSNFIVRQVFFCGGEKDEFDQWKRGLADLAKQSTKQKAERTLRIELDEEVWQRLYSYTSHPIPAVKGQRIAVRVISQFGEESTIVKVVP